MSKLEVHQFVCLSDNYGVLVHDRASGDTAAIDVPEAPKLLAALDQTGWKLTEIFATHHHFDHIQGIEEVKSKTGCAVYGPDNDSQPIPGLDHGLGDGDVFRFGGQDVRIIATPGHTLGQIAYYLPDAGLAFTGDTLFALGCGRVFEGTHEQMWQSLEKLAQLPAATAVYCGHEYTLANARFALTIDPHNQALTDRVAEIEKLRSRGEPTLPTTIGLERATNPFLRAGDPAIRAHLGMANATDAAVFSEIRTRKDNA